MVVGGGPGGLEAARVAALRGHRVMLFEAAGRLGGQLVLAARPQSRQRMIGIADWLAAEVERLGVDVRTNVYAEAETVTAEAPDVAVVATGGLPNTEVFPEGAGGAGSAEGAELVASVWDVLGGHVKPGGDVLLYDDNGRHQGVSSAEFLAASGARVELATPDRAPGFELGTASFPVYLRDLYKLRRPLHAGPQPGRGAPRRQPAGRHPAERVQRARVRTDRRPGGGRPRHPTERRALLSPSSLAPATWARSIRKPFWRAGPRTLERNPEGGYELFRIGDAVASRDVHAAVLEALRLCKDL